MQIYRAFKQCLYNVPAIVFAVMAGSSWANDTNTADNDAPTFLLHGFGTLGVVHSSSDNADFVGNFFQPDGAGYTRSWAMGVDSKLGVQADAQLDNKLSAVVQVVSQHRFNGSYSPQIEWANLQYHFSPDFSVRIGRSVESSFIMSDARLVGYSYIWVRPPPEVYGMFPITNIDGIDVSYGFHIGDVANTLRAGYGKTKLKAPGAGEITGKHFYQIADTVEFGPSVLRISYMSLRASLHNPGLDALFDGYTQFSNAASGAGFSAAAAQALSVANDYQLTDFPYSVFSVGFNYDYENWLLMTEWGKTRTSTLVSKNSGWHVTGGYRIKAFTPYLTLAKLKAEPSFEPGISTVGLGPLTAGATGLNAGLNTLINVFAFSQRTISAGVRWDFMKNTDMKLQYDRLRTDLGSFGRLINVQPGFQPDSAVNMFSFTVDFVF